MVTVVCTGGEAPPSTLCSAWLDAGQRTIAADGGLHLLRRLGRTADLWIGDGDSLGDLDQWQDWYREARRLSTEKDETDTDAAVRTAREEGADEVWLIGGGGGRMDHWWSNLRLAGTEPRLTRWLTGREEAWNAGPGTEIDCSEGTLSVFPLGAGPWKVSSLGLEWPLDSVDWERWHSLSNRVLPRGGKIFVESGRVLIIQPFGEGANP